MRRIKILMLPVILVAIYLLDAEAPVLNMVQEKAGYILVRDWVGINDPVPIKFASQQGNINPVIFKAHDQKHFGMLEHREQVITFTWYDLTGDTMGRFSEPWPFDFPLPLLFIIQEGHKVIYLDALNRIRVYNESGSPEKQWRLFESIPYRIENTTFGNYLPVRDELLIGFRQVSSGEEAGPSCNSYITLVDPEGNQRFNREYPTWQINSLSSSEDNQLFAVALYRHDPATDKFEFKSVVLNEKGSVLADLPIQHRKAVFNKNATLVLFYKNSMAYLYDLAAERIIREIASEPVSHIFMTGLFIPDHDVFVMQNGRVERDSLGWAYKDVNLYVYDLSGSEQQKINLNNVIYQPYIKYDRQGQQLIIGHSSGWQRFAIN